MDTGDGQTLPHRRYGNFLEFVAVPDSEDSKFQVF